jgi:hypothetical protein
VAQPELALIPICHELGNQRGKAERLHKAYTWKWLPAGGLDHGGAEEP